MKTREVAFGGLMIALFISIGLMFRGNIRTVQTYLEIVKTIIVAITIRYISPKTRWVFLTACLATSFIFIPVVESLIYNIPSVIGGYIIGIQKESNKKIVNYLIFFLVNSLMILYEFIVFDFFMQTNLFEVYQNQAAILLSQIFGEGISIIGVKIAFILFMLGDSAFSAAVIYVLSEIVIRKLKVIMSNSI